MLLETSEDIRSVLLNVGKVMNLCKSSVTDKASLRYDCEGIIRQICEIHGRLAHAASEIDADVFPKTIPYTNLLHLQAMNKIALDESEGRLEAAKKTNS